MLTKEVSILCFVKENGKRAKERTELMEGEMLETTKRGGIKWDTFRDYPIRLRDYGVE